MCRVRGCPTSPMKTRRIDSPVSENWQNSRRQSDKRQSRYERIKFVRRSWILIELQFSSFPLKIDVRILITLSNTNTSDAAQRSARRLATEISGKAKVPPASSPAPAGNRDVIRSRERNGEGALSATSEFTQCAGTHSSNPPPTVAGGRSSLGAR